MIARGKTFHEIRDRAHPFGHALSELYDTCDLVCSAPMVVLLTGEHAGVDGSFMLAAPLPLRVYIGIIGRNVYTPGRFPPMLSSFRYYDPLTDTVEEQTHNPEYLGAEENVRNIGSLLVEAVKEQHLRFLPAEIVLLSEAPPGRGANWSGAFSAAIALSLYLLQGENVPAQLDPHNWRSTTQIPKRDQEIEKLFRIALRIECASHSLASGYGPACSLIPALGKLFLYKGFIDPRFATAGGDPRRNLSFSLCHWDTYQQQLATGKRYQPSDLYDILIVDSGRSKSTSDSIGRVRGMEEDNLAQDLINLLANDPNQSADVLAKSASLSDQILRARRIGLTTLSVSSGLAIKTLRDCCGGIEDPRATLRVVSSIDRVLQRLGLSFVELDALREDLGEKLQQQRLAVKLTGGGGGGDMVIWGIPQTINEIVLSEPSKDPQPTLIWQLSRDGLSQEGAMCNHPHEFQGFKRHAASLPAPRDPVLHQAILMNAHGEVTLLPAAPQSLFEVYRALRTLALQGTCLYLYHHSNATKDRFEPLYLTWLAQNIQGMISVKSSPFHPKEGFVLLKNLLLSFAEQRCLQLDNPDPLLEPSGRLRSSTMMDLDLARGALNFEANRLSRQVANLEFPHLEVHRQQEDKVRVGLRLPENSHFFVIHSV